MDWLLFGQSVFGVQGAGHGARHTQYSERNPKYSRNSACKSKQSRQDGERQALAASLGYAGTGLPYRPQPQSRGLDLRMALQTLAIHAHTVRPPANDYLGKAPQTHECEQANEDIRRGPGSGDQDLHVGRDNGGGQEAGAPPIRDGAGQLAGEEHDQHAGQC